MCGGRRGGVSILLRTVKGGSAGPFATAGYLEHDYKVQMQAQNWGWERRGRVGE